MNYQRVTSFNKSLAQSWSRFRTTVSYGKQLGILKLHNNEFYKNYKINQLKCL